MSSHEPASLTTGLRLLLAAAALALGLVTCDRPPPGAPRTNGPERSVSTVVQIDSADAVGPRAETATAQQLSPPAVEKASAPISDATVFQCGQSTCAVGKETCCKPNGNATCVATVPDGKHAVGPFAQQMDRCGPSEEFSRCDESVDCAQGQICCEQFLNSSGSMWGCEKLRPSGDSPCDYGEPCLAGSPCRVPGTVCQLDRCQKPVPDLPCGNARCSADEGCCGAPPSCKPLSQCSSAYERFACTRRSDCLPGQWCVAESTTSFCVGFLLQAFMPGPSGGLEPFIVFPLACEKDSDCPTDTCLGNVPARCGESQISWIRVCICP